ncbi:hypothetical protein GUJ93_ZPchr0011g27960 [Zizania palustris]|uniref:Uncharacterized protein n=1 Tax=Zizania palustris TaxID=103762 RepID=A0A8J6BRM1_ZIZPA|nr:hypothetical protein GUJ93_ZPchr0011g27960 [Zizania palustris]
MAMQLAARSKNPLATAVAVSLLMTCLLVLAAHVSAASLRPTDADVYSACFEVMGCNNVGCAIRCEHLGHNPAGSVCRSKDTSLYCCCGQDNPPSSPSATLIV